MSVWKGGRCFLSPTRPLYFLTPLWSRTPLYWEGQWHTLVCNVERGRCTNVSGKLGDSGVATPNEVKGE